MKKVTISMVTYNAMAYLPFALPSLLAVCNDDIELVILDNASTDQSREYIKTHAPGVRLIESPTNKGFGGGHNEVIRVIDSEYVMVFNQDMVLEPDYIRECVSFMDAHPKVGSVSGILQRAKWDTRGGIEKTDTIDTCGVRIKKSHNAKDMTTVPSWTTPFEIFGPSGACALYRRDALEDVAYDHQGVKEYFDEDFFMYKEDVDLAYRLRWRGWASYTIPTARAYHFRTKGESMIRINKQVNYWSYRNHLYLLIKNVSTGMFGCCLPQIMGYEIAKAGYMIIKEWYRFGVFKDIWRTRTTLLQKRHSIMQSRTITDKQMCALLR